MKSTAQPRVPPVLVGALSDIPTELRRYARSVGLTDAQVEKVVASVPENVLRAPCFLDRLTGLWRYDFGNLIERLPNDQVVLGTHMFPQVSTLLEALTIATQRLGADQLAVYTGRLGDTGRHQDVLAEMLPMRHVAADVPADFEVLGRGGSTVDWMMHPPDGARILLEVKNRLSDLIDYFSVLARKGSAAMNREPAHDHAALLRGLESKFDPVDPVERRQGAWIISQLRQNEEKIRTAFESLDRSRVHFVILNNGGKKGYIIARPEIDRGAILSFFGLVGFRPETRNVLM